MCPRSTERSRRLAGGCDPSSVLPSRRRPSSRLHQYPAPDAIGNGAPPNERGITDGRSEDLFIGRIDYSAWMSGRGEGHLEGGSSPDTPRARLRSLIRDRTKG